MTTHELLQLFLEDPDLAVYATEPELEALALRNPDEEASRGDFEKINTMCGRLNIQMLEQLDELDEADAQLIQLQKEIGASE